MIRQMKIQYSDTWYHVMNRGESSGQQGLVGTDGKGGMRCRAEKNWRNLSPKNRSAYPGKMG